MIPEKLMSIREGLVYMNHAAIGPMPTRALVEHVQGYGQLAAKGEAGLDFEGMITKWDDVRKQFASLINGKTEGVAITTNTASGLHLVADGLSHLFKPGANIVINEMEFTTNSYLWQKVCKRYGLELRVAPYANHFSQLETLIDNQTVLVSISFVQFSNGYTADMEWISRLCKENNAFFVVDAIQGLGAVPFDVERMGVDFVASGGYKWLIGPLGSGYFYANPRHDDIFDSVMVGWFGDRDFSRMTHHNFEPWPDARQYQTYLSPMFFTLSESLQQIMNWKVNETHRHVKLLIDRLVEGIAGTPYSVNTVLEEKYRSGIIKIDHPDAENIVERLKQENIIVSLRDGGIRISPHRHNTEEQMDLVINSLKRAI